MADEPQSGGFSLTKKYGPLPAWAWGLIGGATLYVGYRYWKSRASAGSTAASTAATGADTTAIDYAPQISVLQSEIQQLQGEESSEPVDKDTVPAPPSPPHGRPGGGRGTPPPAPGKGGRVRVPNVVGQNAAHAISTIEAAGLEVVTSPFRNSKRQYTVSGQTPKGGTMVPRHSPVTLRVRVTSKPAPPRGRTPARA